MIKPLLRVAPLTPIPIAIISAAFAAVVRASAETLSPGVSDFYSAAMQNFVEVAQTPSFEDRKQSPSPTSDNSTGVANDIDDSDNDADSMADTSSSHDHDALLPSRNLDAGGFRARDVGRDLLLPPLQCCRLLEEQFRERAPPNLK